MFVLVFRCQIEIMDAMTTTVVTETDPETRETDRAIDPGPRAAVQPLIRLQLFLTYLFGAWVGLILEVGENGETVRWLLLRHITREVLQVTTYRHFL